MRRAVKQLKKRLEDHVAKLEQERYWAEQLERCRAEYPPDWNVSINGGVIFAIPRECETTEEWVEKWVKPYLESKKQLDSSLTETITDGGCMSSRRRTKRRIA